jgi:peptidyl-prolyl cis-trans isomerase SurA
MHQAIQDSVKVTDAEVKGMMEERLSYMVGQIGSMDKVINITRKVQKKNSSYFFDILKRTEIDFKCKMLRSRNYT